MTRLCPLFKIQKFYVHVACAKREKRVLSVCLGPWGKKGVLPLCPPKTRAGYCHVIYDVALPIRVVCAAVCVKYACAA